MSDSDTDQTRLPNSSILPGFLGRSFLAKFGLALLLVIVAIGGVSAVTYQQTSEQLTQDVSTEYRGLASQSANQIQDWQDSRIETARFLSQFGVIRSQNQGRQQEFLESESSRLADDIYRVHLVDLDTRDVLASTFRPKANETLNTAEAPWLGNVSYGSDRVFVSDADEIQGRSIVAFVAPVDDGDADTRRAIVVMTNLDEVSNGLPTPSDSSQVFSQVVDDEGRVVAGTQEQSRLARNDGVLEQYSGDDGVQSSWVEAGLGGNDGFDEIGTVEFPNGNNEPAVAGYAPVPGDELVVVTHVPESYAYALRQTVTRNLGVITGTTFLGLLLIALTFGRGTVQALNRLTGKARELESGNLDVDLEPNRADEFGSLTASFASMRDALREQITEAEQARKEAEVSRAEATEMNQYLQDTAQRYSEVMQECARGDLTQRLDPDGENDAMDQIAENFNEMLSELELTTGQLKTFAEQVGEGGRAVQESAETVRNASEQVAVSVQEIADDAYDQRERMEQISEEIQRVADNLESMAEENEDIDFGDSLERIRAVAETVDEASELTDEAMAESETVAGAAEEQAAELDDVSERASELTQYAQYLGEGLRNFETEEEHEFVFQTGGSGSASSDTR